jgi:hypothetical protein
MIESVYIEDKMKIDFAIVMAVVVYGIVAYEMVSGHLTIRGFRVTRASDPGEFWLYVAFKFIVATTCLLSSIG